MATEVTDAVMRRNYTRDLMKVIARNDLHSSMNVRADDGSAPIVMALGTDCMSNIHARIQSAGGAANLVVLTSDEKLHIIDMTRANAAGARDSAAAPAEVHQDITMDFLISYMEQQPENSGLLRIAFDGVDVSASENKELSLV